MLFLNFIKIKLFLLFTCPESVKTVVISIFPPFFSRNGHSTSKSALLAFAVMLLKCVLGFCW